MTDPRKIPCTGCGKDQVVADYVEGDEREVICDACEQRAYDEAFPRKDDDEGK